MCVHLYTRSSYSLLQSTIRMQEWIPYAKSLAYDTVTLCDHNVMYGVASFLDVCKKEGMHAIVGMEVDCLYHEEVVPFVLLAKDNQGYKDLMQLSSYLQETSTTCLLQHLQHCSAHCHIIVYGEGGWFDGEIVNENVDGIRHKLEIMKQEIGSFDVALSYMEASLWKMRNQMVKRICQSMRIPTVALNKIYYLRPNEGKALQILRGIATNKTIHDSSLTSIQGRHYLSKEEMHALYETDDLQRTVEIASMCRADYQLPKTTLIQYPLKQGITPKTYLQQLCLAGLQKRLEGKYNQAYMDRLQYELSVIMQMHFENYFLIVYDFICHARKKGIYIGPGRGSAAGSLVAYCLGITMIDPMQYHLLFERFLNPERISMPDIDVDIPDKNRSEVIQYVYEKYGEDHICNIVTFGSLGARQVIRDVGKVLNMFSRDIDAIVKLIPTNNKLTLQQAYQTNAKLKQKIASEAKYQQLFTLACQLEGLPRHTSIHAGGILMSQLPLHDIIPTTRHSSQMRTSQYTMEYLEERGLIKIDFLGLRNLSIIDDIVKQIQKRNPQFDIMRIPLEDARTYTVFSRGDTIGVFQFESEGIKQLLKRLQPKNINELAAAMALYRPGPMDNIPMYLKNKQNPSQIQYASKQIAPILQETYGIMIYQEQIMLLARVVARFSLAKADILRKAISKKKVKEMENLKVDFMKGARENGYDVNVSESLFREIEKFAGYGFNKSHAIAYSYIAYQMAYLKANYPFDFYIALLNSVIHDTNKTAQYIDECKRRGIVIHAPSINVSQSTYIFDKQGIRLPLTCMKGMSEKASEAIILERQKRGMYVDLFDFVARCYLHDIKRAQIEALIDGGSCDCLHETRITLKNGLDQAESYASVVQIHKADEMTLDLGLVSKPVLIRRKEDLEVKEEYERDALGFTLGQSRITQLRKQYHIALPSLSSLIVQKGNIEGFACIKEVKNHRTKKGDMMAFMKLQDDSASMDVMVMPRQYMRYSSSLVKGRYIVFRAKIQEDGAVFIESIQFVNVERK